MNIKKPTGKSGYIRIQNDDTNSQATFKKVQFSDVKEEIEKNIVSRFTAEMKKQGAVFLNEEKLNEQNDFDLDFFFLVVTYIWN